MDNTLPPHDCNKFVEQVFLVLDGELNEADTDLFLKDIERCSHCLKHYNIEKELKAFITKRMERKTCSESLRQAIVQQIHNLENEQEG